MTQNDQRYHARYLAANLRVNFKPASFFRHCVSSRSAIGIDFSQGGMSFQTTHRLKPGKRLLMSLTNRFLHLQTLPAEVVHQQPTGDCFEYGVRFLLDDLSVMAAQSVRHMLLQFEQQLRKEQPERSLENSAEKNPEDSPADLENISEKLESSSVFKATSTLSRTA